MKHDKAKSEEVPAMPFNEALKRVWSAPPMPKVKPKPAKPPEPNNSRGRGG